MKTDDILSRVLGQTVYPCMVKIVFAVIGSVTASLLQAGTLRVDFGTAGSPVQSGYQAYTATDKNLGSFSTQSYAVLGTTVSLTPSWAPNAVNDVARVINRGQRAYEDATEPLMQDWIGSDTYHAGDPLTLTISGFPAGEYSWVSYHTDTEPTTQLGTFDVTVNDASGSATTMGIKCTNSTAVTFDSVAKFETTITSNGVDAVTIVYDLRPYTNRYNEAYFVMNGFVIEFSIEPDPYFPVSIYPASGQDDVSVTTAFQWSAPTAYTPAFYEIFLGTNPVVSENRSYTIATEEFQPAQPLHNDTTYYWAVIAYDGTTPYVSGTWSFTTMAVSRPEFTGDNVINTDDLAEMAAEWLSCSSPVTDVTGDGCVNLSDFGVLSQHWLYENPFFQKHGMTKGSKWVGNIARSNESTVPSNFLTYWNQLTPENSTKWGSVESTRNVMRWGNCDTLYAFCKTNQIPFKFHTLVWGSQEPGWVKDLPANEQLQEVLEWFQAAAARMPDPEYIDVVNEPIHAPASYRGALGGAGETGWDWIVWSFEQARIYFPNSKLLINEYGIISNPTRAREYADIVNILKSRGLVDGIGIQCHYFNMDNVTVNTMNQVLGILGATGVPIYVSELDMRGTDTVQLQWYQTKFPVLFESPYVKGITLWGYREGLMWAGAESHLIRSNGEERPAMVWLKQYLSNY